MTMLTKALALTALLVTTSACADQRAMQVTDAWSRATPPGLTVGVAYLVIRNRTGRDDLLLSATTPRTVTVELHATTVTNGITSMQRQTSVPIAAGAEIKMQPGGLHFMLLGLNKALVAGERVPLTLRFAHAGAIDVDVAVRAIGE
jgi:copper(I)-binding protein